MKRNGYGALCGFCLALATCSGWASELRFCLRADPRTFDPLQVDDGASDTVRYLTGGVLMRLNRRTQQLQPELATAWTVNAAGNSITFTLRPNVRFSDGTPFAAEDVAYTVRRLMDPALHSPTGDAFRSGEGAVVERVLGRDRITIVFPHPVVGLDKLFDQVAMESARSPLKERAVLGPYFIAEYKPGQYLLLKKNSHYWKHDAQGNALPYIDTIRLEIEPNPDMEMLRLLRGQIDLIDAVDAAHYDQLAARAPKMAMDAGVSLDSEQVWFNQTPSSLLPAYKKAWFTSANFRRAISESIDRGAMARVVYRGHARAAVSWVSPANRYWFDSKLPPYPLDRRAALRLLAREGFSQRNGTLYDKEGHAVEFSVITNAGNTARERMATMMQQDLAAIGIRLNVVTLDFPSLIERITRSFNYEACLLGLVNNDLDPNSQMNVWLSSAETHQWNPAEKKPATAWEAEIDGLMRMQASTMDLKKRKQAIDRVQEIVRQQEPFLYLVNSDALVAVSPRLHNVEPVVLRPQVFWNIEWLWLSGGGGR